MYRFFFVFVVLFATLSTTFAIPTAAQNGTLVDLEKRVTHVGRGTWFHTGQGNCGQWNTDQDPIVAMALAFYNQNNGVNCGQWLQITNTANSKTTLAYVHDSCPGCSWNDLDMSPAVFSQLADLSVGVLEISWYFMPPSWHP